MKAPQELQKISVQSYKYGERLHYEWETIVLERTDAYVLVLSEYGRKLRHYTRGQTFTMNSWTLEWFSLVDGFTVSADVRDGGIHRYYCNINLPATFEEDVLRFVDLDLDYVYRDGSWKVIDEDEFEEHRIRYSYPADVVAFARSELRRLQKRIERREFPFDGTLERRIPEIQSRFIDA
jgi:protein associated with RNAse G/E